MPELKTFRGTTVTEALTKVKKDLGPHAVIVNTRSFRAGAVLGLGGKPCVEIDASAPPPASLRPPLRDALVRMYEDVPARRVPVAVQPPQREPAASPPVPAPSSKRQSSAGPSRLAALPVEPDPQDSQAAESLRDELGSIKTMVGQLLRCSNQSAVRVGRDRHGFTEAPVFENGSLPEPLFAHYTRLIDAGVDVPIAQTIIATVRDALAPQNLEDARAVRAAVLESLSAQIPCSPLPPLPDAKPNSRATRPTIIAMIGPTGVGKTTTIAKLAADIALRQGRKVALITADTYRIGAVDQLRAYAEIIGVPLEVAGDPQAMASAIERQTSAELILIDTAGRSPSDDLRLDELAQVLDAAHPDHRLLVLSASASDSSLDRTFRRFADLAPDRIILSKLDESPAMGVLINTPRRTGVPLSHVTTGQDVPDFLSIADPRALAVSVLDGELPR